MLVKSIQRVVLGICLTAPFAFAQTSATSQSTTQTTGSFTGHLTGGGMDGATVTLTNPATGESQSATTDSDGTFTITNLSPGTYRAVVRLKSGLQLREGSIDITSAGASQIQLNSDSLPAAAVGKLELEGRSPTLELNSAEVSRSYDSQFLRSLPVLDRQNQELITLMPGTTPPVLAGDRIEDPQRIRTFNVNGLPAYANLYNQDGVYDNEPFNGAPLRTEPNESVQALEVRTSNYNAEYGVSGGSWASTTTRPGTNAIHGSLFEFNTNSYLTDGGTFAEMQSTPRSVTNQFGGSAGGPVIPDKMFWFVSYEGLIQRGGEAAVANVPATGFGSGNFSQVPGATIYNPFSGDMSGANRVPYSGNTIPMSALNPSSQAILAMIPL